MKEKKTVLINSILNLHILHKIKTETPLIKTESCIIKYANIYIDCNSFPYCFICGNIKIFTLIRKLNDNIKKRRLKHKSSKKSDNVLVCIIIIRMSEFPLHDCVCVFMHSCISLREVCLYTICISTCMEKKL